jgi:hypothetical protein
MPKYNFDAGPGEPVCTPDPAAPPTTPDPANDAPVPDHATPESDTAPEPADGDPAPALDPKDAPENGGTQEPEDGQPATAPRIMRAGWFSVSHDDLDAVLAASAGSTALRNMAVWVHLLRIANRKQSLEFQISCEVVGADLRGVDRRIVRVALEVLRDCGLLTMSDAEKNTATGYFKPTTIRLHPTCSPVRGRVKKTHTDNAEPCTRKVQGDSDTVSPAVLKIPSCEGPERDPSQARVYKRVSKDHSKRGDARGGGRYGPANAVPTPPRAPARNWNKRKPTADNPTTKTPQLKAVVL